MNEKIIDFALQAGVLDNIEGVVEEDEVETFTRYILQETLEIIRNCEEPEDACHAIKDHFDILGVE
jgi:hypothetical protein